MARPRAAVPAAAAASSASSTSSRSARRAPPPPRGTSPGTYCSGAAAKATAFVRVAGLSIKESTFKVIAPANQRVAVLWDVLKHCVVPAEQRFHVQSGSGDIPAALAKIEVGFPWGDPTNASILDKLATDHPALVRSIRTLHIEFNADDESAALGAFAALATELQELTIRQCGLTSLRGLEGRCDHLRKVDLWGCEQLTSIDPLAERVHFEEFIATRTRITSIKPLCSCPNLTKVILCSCEQLSSIDALADHQRLQEVDVSSTGITSIEPLRSCLDLTKVDLRLCRQLSIEALADHQQLQEVDASSSDITSIEPLRSCPNLTKVYLIGCRQLSSIDALADHQRLQEVDVSGSDITSIEPLQSCPNLTKVGRFGCKKLSPFARFAIS